MDLKDISMAHHATLCGHLDDVTWVDFSYDMLATCSSDKTVRLWDMSAPEQEITELGHSPLLGHRYIVYRCCFSPHGKILATCSRDGHVILWDPKNGNTIDVLAHPSEAGIRVCKFSPDSCYLATGGDDDTLVIWAVATRKILRTLNGHDAAVTACSFTPDNNFIISGSMNGDLRLWSVKSGSDVHLAHECEGHDLGVLGCEFSPYISQTDHPVGDKYLLATCGNDEDVHLFNIVIGISNSILLKGVLKGHGSNVMCCRFSPTGNLLASASGDKTVIIWNVETMAITLKLLGHQRYVTSCAFSQCSNYVASSSNDKTVLIWKITGCLGSNLARQSAVLPADALACSSSSPENEKQKFPDEFYCPITHELMRDPVIAADGFSYERNAIAKWFEKGKNTSPMTNVHLEHTQLTPNYALKTLIQHSFN